MAREFIQSDSTNQWFSVQSSKNGWKNFIPNHWTKYAEDNSLELGEQRISYKRRRKTGIRSFSSAKSPKIQSLNCLIKNHWTEWHEKNTKPSTEYTISGYKKVFKGKRPEWSLNFNERKIPYKNVINDKNKICFLVPENLRSKNHHTIEREIYSKDFKKGIIILIERIISNRDICNRVTMVRLRTNGGPFLIRQEDKLSRTEWQNNTSTVYDSEWTKAKHSKLLKLPEPWANYF